MRELPIIFSGPMVRAILDGKKTQTRRIKFRGEVGDRLWAKEPLVRYYDITFYPWVYYMADGVGTKEDWRWQKRTLPAMFMPKRLARIWLEVTAIREEPLQEITDADVRREGFYGDREMFYGYWDALYLKRPEQWVDENPIVKVITFERVK